MKSFRIVRMSTGLFFVVLWGTSIVVMQGTTIEAAEAAKRLLES